MRPVERGEWPVDASGKRTDYSKDYTPARGPLIDRLGEYCSFCEARMQSSLAVEHVLPKKTSTGQNIPGRFGDWDNFLLSCVNCNSRKGTKEIPCLLPDRNNTFFALEYREGGCVFPCESLTDKEKELAQNLIDLVGLNHKPPMPDLRKSDRRWLNRFNAWNKAKDYREKLMAADCDEALQEYVIRLIQADGHWSIWMTVCRDLRSLCARLVEEFPGTAKRYFDHGAVREVI